MPLNKNNQFECFKNEERDKLGFMQKMPIHNYFKNKNSMFHGLSIT